MLESGVTNCNAGQMDEQTNHKLHPQAGRHKNVGRNRWGNEPSTCGRIFQRSTRMKACKRSGNAALCSPGSGGSAISLMGSDLGVAIVARYASTSSRVDEQPARKSLSLFSEQG